MTCFSRIFQLRIHEFCSTKFLINSWHQNHQKFMIYEINFLRHFVYFIFWLDQKQGELLQTAISTIYLLNSLEHASRKINVFHRIIKEIKKINKNKKINHEYFGGSNVTNVLFDDIYLLDFSQMLKTQKKRLFLTSKKFVLFFKKKYQ